MTLPSSNTSETVLWRPSSDLPEAQGGRPQSGLVMVRAALQSCKPLTPEERGEREFRGYISKELWEGGIIQDCSVLFHILKLPDSMV